MAAIRYTAVWMMSSTRPRAYRRSKLHQTNAPAEYAITVRSCCARATKYQRERNRRRAPSHRVSEGTRDMKAARRIFAFQHRRRSSSAYAVTTLLGNTAAAT